ncbi:MAG: hypothetical protein ACOX63_03280 [Christensenellales bacterium]
MIYGATVGWRRDGETEAVTDFAKIVMFVAAEMKQDAELQKIARRFQLIATQVALAEMMDIDRRKSVVADRLRDCADCREQGTPACAEGGQCKYKTAAFRYQAIRKHYGEEALEQVMPKLNEYARKHTTKEET